MTDEHSFLFYLQTGFFRLWRARSQEKLGFLLLFCGIFTLIVSLIWLFRLSVGQVMAQPATSSSFFVTPSTHQLGSIYVDVAGAVTQPGLYQLVQGDRVATALARAGGVLPQADQEHLSKTVNLAELVKDSDKIYIPYTPEIAVATKESNSVAQTEEADDKGSSALISLNTATLAELDTLPGIGASRAEAIVAGRPYQKVSELTDRGIVPTNTFLGLKEFIQL